jgi:hypothetical protein
VARHTFSDFKRIARIVVSLRLPSRFCGYPYGGQPQVTKLRNWCNVLLVGALVR